MTSLVSTPKHKISDPKLFISELDENLFTVWRSSRTASLARKRLRNRSWRLISERILNHKAFDRSILFFEEETLSQEASSMRAAILQSRPSLFLDLSKYTFDSSLTLQQVKLNGLEQVSGEESSDISEDEMPAKDYSEYDPERAKTASSAPPPVSDMPNKIGRDIQQEGAAKLSMCPNHSLTCKNVSQKHASHINSSTKTNIFFISNSPSSNAPDNHNGKESLTNDHVPNTRVSPTLQDSLFKSNASISTSSTSNAPSSVSSTDISEVSSPDDHLNSLHENDMNQAIANARSARSGRSLKLADDTESEWMSVSSESELAPESPVVQPISFPKRIPVPHSLSDESHPSPPADETLKSSPILKPRSLLSGLFLNEINSAAQSPGSTKSANLEHLAPKPVLKRSSTTGVITVDPSNNARGVQRPSIFLARRYTSSSDVTRKALPHRSPKLYIAEENSIKEDLSKSGEQNMFAKQTSSVGLSNFLVMSDAKNNTQQAEFGSPKAHIAHDAGLDGVEALSSSLSKFSNLQHVSSLKNILSKSAINLTSLLGSGITGKLRLHSDNRSNETLKSMPAQHLPHAVPAMASLFAEHLSQQSLMEPTNSESTITTSKSVRVEPTVFKSFTPSVEISASLKDSLMIDHRLGKAPLPERVISDEDLFTGHDKESFLNDSNDYHSKGW